MEFLGAKHDSANTCLGPDHLDTRLQAKESRCSQCMLGTPQSYEGDSLIWLKAAEKSLSELKALPQTSDAQLAAGKRISSTTGVGTALILLEI